MNKRITSLLISLALLAFVLVGVASCTPTTENECQHDWAAATCSAPKTCTICSETEGTALGHSWTEATCTEAKVCSVCSATEGTALGHSWVDATCTEAKTCSVCSVTEGEALGHSWVGGSCTEGMHCANCSATEGAPIGHTWVEATCTEAKHCSVCSATEGTAPGHSWVDATCTEKKHCSVCSATEGVALGHTGGSASCNKKAECDRCGSEYGLLTDHLFDQQNPVSHYLVSAATCEASAVYYISCACGAQGEETFVYGDPLGHDIVYQKAVDETGTGVSIHIVVCLNDCGIFNTENCSGGTATCIEKAECQYCGAEYGDEPSHNWVEGATTPAGCENAGSIAYQCSVCSETKSETIAPLGHSYVVTVVNATCNSVGYTNHKCSACDYSYNDSEVSALSHVWNIDPTCASGRYCTLGCGATEEALAHNYVKGNTVAPGCLTDGYTVSTCQNGCGDSIHVDIVSATGHNIDGVEAIDVHVAGCEYKQTYVCNSCNLTVDGKTVYHHAHKASVVFDATCVSLGEWLYKCENCSDSYTKTIEKNDNHAWDNGVKSGNIITYTCTACSKTKTVVDASGSTSTGVSKDDLANAGEVKLENANINLGGITNGVLSDKDDITVSANTIDKNELIGSGLSEEELAQVGNNPVYDFSLMSGNESIHDFGGGLVTVTLPYTLSEGEDVDSIAVWYIDDEGKLTSIKATYSNGYVTFETDHFSYYTVTRLTPAQRCEIYGHNDSVMTVGATCTEDGYTLTRCIRCARTIKTVTEKAYGHNLETVQVDATCTENGRISISCKNCSYFASQVIPAPGHNYVVISGQDPTCEKEGSVTYKCNNCSNEYTAKLPPVSHDYQDTVVEAGCGTPGYTEHSCKNCTHSYKDNHQPAKEHEFDDEHCVWTFSSNNKKAHVVLSCKNNCGFTVEGDVDTTERMHDAECGGRIVREFVARYTYNGVTYSSSVTVEEGDIKDHDLKDKWTHNEHEHWIGCRGCGIKHELAPHEWIDTVVLTQPTCEKHGWVSMTCYCGRTVKEKIPATEDHYYVNGVCAGCGLEETGACDHTELTEVTFNLADYGYCAGAFLYRSCECGEVKVVDHLEAVSDITCSIVTDSQEVDGNHITATGHCTKCGLKLKADMKQSVEGCMVSMVVEYGFYTEDGEEIVVFNIVQTAYNHGSTTEKPIGVATSCGTVIYGEYCDACDTLIEVSDIDAQCPNLEEYMEEVNEYYEVYGYRCADCGLLLQAEEKVTVQGTCYYTWTMTIIFKIGDVEYCRIVDTETDTRHEHEAKNVEMFGTSCSDGYKAEMVCVHCGHTYTYSGSSHHTKSETINLADYGMCDGTAEKYTCMICNQVTGCYINYYSCSMNYEGNEGNLSVYRCSTCGIARYSGSEQISGENSCQYISKYVNRYYNASGELVLDISYENVYTSHNYNYTYELIGSSCDDGYIAYGVCNCGATTQYNGSGHHTEWKHVYFDEEFGLCYGNYYGDFCTNCDYVRVDGYYAGNCSWNKIGEENGFEIHSCRNCGVVRHMKVDKTEMDENCSYEVNTEIYYYLRGECILHFEIYNSYNEHEYEYSYEFDGERNCESGVTIHKTCKNCDYSHESRYYYHVNITYDHVEFADYDSCDGNGYIEYYSCPCGYSSGINCYSCGNGSYQSNQYRDDEGRLVYVESYTCTDCQLRYTNSYYIVKGDNCVSTYYYTVMVSFGDTLVFSRDYTRTGTSHNIIRTVALQDGAKSCDDGVIVTDQCTDCYYSSSYTTDWHQTGLQERIDVSNHGSDCGGFVDIMVCACGASCDINVENCLCDLDHYGTQVWIDGAMINEGQETADGYHSFSSYAYIYSCAVTDPEKCGFAIRYCTYWVAEGNCTAVQYLTVQIGYGDGSVKEYTYKMNSRTYHNYVHSNIDNGSKYECSDCGSYYLSLYHDGDNYYAHEYKYVNTLNDGCNKERTYYHEYTYYDFDGDGSRNSYTTKNYYYYVYADGSEYWDKYDYSYEAYNAPFGSGAYICCRTYTNSDGNVEKRTYIETVYKNHSFTLFEKTEHNDGSWDQYEHTYDFTNGCYRTTVYTNSHGYENAYTNTCHITTWTNVIEPTCTQPGLYAHYCVICEQVIGENSELEPNDHNWYQITDDLYYCMTCRMQGIGGADGVMVIEDLTSKYGNNDKYVIGYWNRSNVEFEVYVSLIFINELGEEDQWILFDGIDINYSTDPYIGIWVSRAQVKAAAAAVGFTDESKYAVRISFVPVTASSEFDYAITFDDLADEDDMDHVVHDDAFLELFVPNGEYVEIKIESDVTTKWAFYSMVSGGDPYAYLVDANGNELASNDDGNGNLNFLIEYTLEAGKTYYLRVRWLNQNEIGYIPVVIDKR